MGQAIREEIAAEIHSKLQTAFDSESSQYNSSEKMIAMCRALKDILKNKPNLLKAMGYYDKALAENANLHRRIEKYRNSVQQHTRNAEEQSSRNAEIEGGKLELQVNIRSLHYLHHQENSTFVEKIKELFSNFNDKLLTLNPDNQDEIIASVIALSKYVAEDDDNRLRDRPFHAEEESSVPVDEEDDIKEVAEEAAMDQVFDNLGHDDDLPGRIAEKTREIQLHNNRLGLVLSRVKKEKQKAIREYSTQDARGNILEDGIEKLKKDLADLENRGARLADAKRVYDNLLESIKDFNNQLSQENSLRKVIGSYKERFPNVSEDVQLQQFSAFMEDGQRIINNIKHLEDRVSNISAVCEEYGIDPEALGISSNISTQSS